MLNVLIFHLLTIIVDDLKFYKSMCSQRSIIIIYFNHFNYQIFEMILFNRGSLTNASEYCHTLQFLLFQT